MSDSEYTDSEYESDNDEDYSNNITYEPEEPCVTRFNISVCELYNETIHGDANNLDVLYQAGINNILKNIEYYYDKPYTCNSVLKELFERGVIEKIKETQI